MDKQSFLVALREGLSGLPTEDVEERLNFYSEMIDDRMEEGLAENEAVAAIGSVDQVVSQILAEISLYKIVKEKVKRRKKQSLSRIIFLAVCSPIWFSLLVSALAVVVSLYVSVWACIVSLWSAFASFAGCGLGGLIASVIFAARGYGLTGICAVAAALVCIGLSYFTFHGCLWITKGFIRLTGRGIMAMKNAIMKGDVEQ